MQIQTKVTCWYCKSCMSLLRVNNANSNQSNMLILQESCTDSTGSFVIYTPVDTVAMILNWGDTNYLTLLPLGFAILPDGTISHEIGPRGFLLTCVTKTGWFGPNS